MRLQPGTEILCAAVLFDLDGTLVDSTEVVERVWHRWAARHNVDAITLLNKSHGRRTIETVREFAPKGADHDEEARLLLLEEITDSDGVYPIEGARDFISQLPSDRWAVVTSGNRPLAERRITVAGLPIPNILISADDVSNGKPNPEGYLLAARRLGYSPQETLVFEDALPGLLAARAAGARTIAISTLLDPDKLANEDWIPDFSCVSVHLTQGNVLSVTIGS